MELKMSINRLPDLELPVIPDFSSPFSGLKLYNISYGTNMTIIMDIIRRLILILLLLWRDSPKSSLGLLYPSSWLSPNTTFRKPDLFPSSGIKREEEGRF
jgi:hypothetical protein